MKFKLDENLPLQIAVEIRARKHDIETVAEEGLTGRSDADIWQAAQREGCILVTQDLDFSDTRKFQPGTHHGIVLIRLQSPSRRNLISRATELFEAENVSGWAGCFVVVTERKIRVKRPGPARN
jgi:predicted nuclease of predicted toxin-antitoxin system